MEEGAGVAENGSPTGGWRRASMTVEQLGTSLGARLAMPPEPVTGDDPAKLAEAQLAAVLLRSRLLDHCGSIAEANATTLVFAEDAVAAAEAIGSQACAILLPPPVAEALLGSGVQARAALLVTPQPRLAFARAAQLLRVAEAGGGVHATAAISPGARLGPRVSVGQFAVVEAGATLGAGSEIGAGAVIGAGVEIGCDCRICPNAVLYPGVRLGDRVVVHAGAVLGSDGFGYVLDPETGAYLQFPQQGTLLIEDDVEIGANTTIDRGALEQTRIGRGVKLDNLVHIGHNVQVGENVVIASQTGISGSSTIGRGAVLAGQVGLGDHVEIGEGVILGGQGGVLPHKTLRGPGVLFWGTPAKPVKQYLRELATLTRLARRKAGPPGSTDQTEEGK